MAEISAPTSSNSKRAADASFDLNLAPFLDIIVSIIPMLLLTAVFVEIKSIETPVPQVVAEAMKEADKKSEKDTTITVRISKSKGFNFEVVHKGQKTNTLVPTKAGSLDYSALYKAARDMKMKYPQVFQAQLSPDPQVSYDDVVKTIDSLRRQGNDAVPISFVDPKTNTKMQTNLLFPNVSFGNVVGE